MKISRIISNLSVYGFSHALIDAICAAVIFSLIKSVDSASFFNLVIIYSVIAFGLQVPFGVLVDKIKMPRASAIIGSIITGIAMFTIGISPYLSIVLAGLGNALFHIGGGIISLNLTPKKASAPGIFVAPGAIGLFVGTLLGRANYQFSMVFSILIIISCILILVTKSPKINYNKKSNKVNYFELILLLLLISIAVRAFVGTAIIFPWKSNIALVIVLVSAVFLGKGLGGIIADKFGWIRTATISLLLSLPFLVFFPNIAYLGIIGMFLFNMTMPIILVAVSNMFPGRPGLSFGLNCLALLIGVFPFFIGGIFLKNSFVTSLVILVSVAFAYIGLYFLKHFKVNGS